MEKISEKSKQSKLDIQQELSAEQQAALEMLQSGENVFVTGGAGCGKSFLIRHFLQEVNKKAFPVLASTGVAAVLLGGRTFHSFFALGIMEGGPQETFKRLREDARLLKRLREVEGFILDEVSMIAASALEIAESLSRIARQSELPWGGMRVIVVGDFAQLPPVTRTGQKREWTFESPTWQQSGFQVVELTHSHRSFDQDFLDVLKDVRVGKVTDIVKQYLSSRMMEHDESDDITRLFPRRDQAEYLNQKKLSQIHNPEVRIPSIYIGESKLVEALKRNSPIADEIVLKVGCQVLFLQNDPQKRWVNGTRGTVVEIHPEKIVIEKETWRHVTVEKTQFSLQDATGKTVASVINFPLTLAYATTIHKSQGSTLDDLWVDLSRLWEPGHAYVALSRLRLGSGLRLLGWSHRSIMADSAVLKFYQNLKN